MAQLALAAAGAAIGSGFAGIAVGGAGWGMTLMSGQALGWTVGSMLGGALFPPKMPDGPRLQDKAVQVSTYGVEIPRLYGTARLAGNVIYSSELKETATEQGGKGGPSYTTYSYRVDCAVSICRGPITGVRKIWADSVLIYDVSTENEGKQRNFDASAFRIYLGSEEQLADPLLEAVFTNTPAYRGQAYVVFADFQLEKFGNRLPNFTFEAVNGDIVQRTYSEIASQPGSNSDFTLIDPLTGYLWVCDRDNNATINVIDPISKEVIKTLVGTTSMTDPSRYRNLAYDPDRRTFAGVSGYRADSIVNVVDVWSADSYALINTFDTYYDGVTSFPQDYIFMNPKYTPSNGIYLLGNFVVGRQGLRGYTTDGVHLGLFADAPPQFVEGGFIKEADIFYCGDGSEFLFFDAFTMGLLLKVKPLSGYVTNPSNNRKMAYDKTRNRMFWISGGAEFTVIDLTNLTASEETLTLGDGVVSLWNATYFSQLDIYVCSNFAPAGAPASISIYDAETFAFKYQIEEVGLTGTVPEMLESDYYDDRVLSGLLSGGYNLFLTPTVSVAYISLADVITQESEIAGIDASQIDVTGLEDTTVYGYAVTSSGSIRGAIEPLMLAYQFDAVESSGKLKFVLKKDADTIDVEFDDLAQHEMGSTTPEPFPITRADEIELPRSVTIKYLNPVADYQMSAQAAYRTGTGSKNDLVIDVPIVLLDEEAKQIADVAIYSAWAARTKTSFATSIKYANIEPTDIARVSGNVVRITKRSLSGNMLKFEGEFDSGNVYIQNAVAPSAFPVTQTIPFVGQTAIEFLDIPALRDSDNDSGFYVAANGYLPGWSGCILFKSIDGGTSWSDITSISNASVMGATGNALPAFDSNIWDNISTLDVVVRGGSLFSAAVDAVLNGANAALVGNEVIQFKTATQTGDNSYTLSGLLRGRRGTSTDGHIAGERFVLLSEASLVRLPMEGAEIGLERLYKAVTTGRTLSTAQTISFANFANGLECISPVKLSGGRDSSGNLQINWKRRTRVGGSWRDFVDAPLGETSESYSVKVYDGTDIVRTIDVTTNLASYTAAQQTTDFGSPQSSVDVVVYQNSATNGPGFTISGSI